MSKFLITCLPLVAVLWAWHRVYRNWDVQPVHLRSLIALGIVTANAAIAAGTFAYYAFRPTHLAAWQDPEILTFSLLFLLAPVGMVSGFVASKVSANWLLWVVVFASLWLFFVGVLAGMAV